MSKTGTHQERPDPDQPRRPAGHPVLTIAAWLFGAGAAALTVLVIRVVIAVYQEWSGYVGGESTAALVILGLLGMTTLIAWLVTWAIVRARRG